MGSGRSILLDRKRVREKGRGKAESKSLFLRAYSFELTAYSLELPRVVKRSFAAEPKTSLG